MCPCCDPNFLIPAAPAQLSDHTGVMDDEVVFMVRGKSRAVCQQYLDLVCTLIGATPTRKPTDVMPPGWVAGAVLRPAGEPASEPHT